MKARAIKFYVREINGSAIEIVNARQEISRGSKEYGVGWKFEEVSRDEFLQEIEKDDKVYCIETASRKFIEVDSKNIRNFNI